MRKVVFKERHGAKVRKRYDIARTPFQRSLEKDVSNDDLRYNLLEQHQNLNPLALHRNNCRHGRQGAPGHTSW